MKKKLLLTISVTVTFAILITLAIVLPPILINPYRFDNDAPTIKQIQPYDKSVVAGSIEISFEAVDEGENPSGVESYEIMVDNEVIASTNSCTWDTTEYADGTHHIVQLRAFDKNNNLGFKNISLVVDNFINPPRSKAFKVMAYNILESGMRTPWLNVMKEESTDVAILSETGLLDNGRNLEIVENELNGHFYYKAPYDGRAVVCNASTDGIAFLSRYPILEFHTIDKYRLDDGSIHIYHRAFADAVINVSGIVTHFIGYHGKCCSPDRWTNTTLMRENETQGIINYMDDLGDVPIMLGGDFNSNSPFDVGDVAGVAHNLGTGPIRMLLIPDDPVYGKYSSHVHNFTDTWRTMYPHEKGWTYGFTDPQYWGRIDFLFVNQHWADKMINGTTGDTPSANISSDHYSVDAFFSLDEDYSYFNKTAFTLEIKHNLSFTKVIRLRKQNQSPLTLLHVNIASLSMIQKRVKV
ncbi:MAG: endonuclease/exonuclease/phosphatase family protein [Candidatus Heimdallarchaeaceae archaeon]